MLTVRYGRLASQYSKDLYIYVPRVQSREREYQTRINSVTQDWTRWTWKWRKQSTSLENDRKEWIHRISTSSSPRGWQTRETRRRKTTDAATQATCSSRQSRVADNTAADFVHCDVLCQSTGAEPQSTKGMGVCRLSREVTILRRVDKSIDSIGIVDIGNVLPSAVSLTVRRVDQSHGRRTRKERERGTSDYETLSGVLCTRGQQYNRVLWMNAVARVGLHIDRRFPMIVDPVDEATPCCGTNGKPVVQRRSCLITGSVGRWPVNMSTRLFLQCFPSLGRVVTISCHVRR